MMRGKREQAGLLAVIIGITATVTACGPRQAHADVGMTVDEAGNPVIVLQVCEGVIDELRLGYPWPTPTPQPDRPAVKLTSRKPFKGATTPYKTARFSDSDYYWVTSLDDFANNRCPK